MKTNYRFINKGNKGAIITHGLLGDINKRSITELETLFHSFGISTITFDIYGHGLSSGKIENITLSKCYQQIQSMNKVFIESNIETVYLYGSSFSSLPILQAGNSINTADTIFIKTPVFEYKKKRERELGMKKMDEWRNKGIIKIMEGYKDKPDIYQKYEFIQDLEDNFSSYDLNSKKLFLAAGIEDPEVPIDELEFLIGDKSNIILKKYKATHRFSKKNRQNLIADMRCYLEKNKKGK